MPGRKKRAGYSKRVATPEPESEEEDAGAESPPPAAVAAEPEKAASPPPPAAAAAAAASDSESDVGSDDSSDDLMSRPLRVEYCPMCTFPAEYCEFSGKLEACKPWLEEQAVKGKAGGINVDGLKEKGKVKKAPTGELPGGKKKKDKGLEVVVSVTKRGGRKRITTVKGLDSYGHKLDDLARQFKKQFSCGCAVVSAAGQPDVIEIQGDALDTLLCMLPAKLKVPTDVIFKVEEKERSKVKYGPDGTPLM
eukprot:TRINITY_DN1001_c6_g1_i1.p1 TRINITY_DN1001_c6_g1~~TRINITY_DN1001_c6_g1_i1.p1  ORF type:complete len:271 (+),score=118.30 TRINITY_DN1001_c6_g1_i1:66-815(+)